MTFTRIGAHMKTHFSLYYYLSLKWLPFLICYETNGSKAQCYLLSFIQCSKYYARFDLSLPVGALERFANHSRN